MAGGVTSPAGVINITETNSNTSGLNFQILQAKASNDTLALHAGDGNDSIDASAVTTNLLKLNLKGEGGNDTVIGGSFADTIDGGEGDNILAGGPGVDVFVTGTGTDTLREQRDADFAITSTQLTIAGEVESLINGSGQPLLDYVELRGGNGNNNFTVSNWSGNLSLDGGEGSDNYTINLEGSGLASISVADSGTGNGFPNSNQLTVQGTSKNDIFLVRRDAVTVTSSDLPEDSHTETINYSGLATVILNGNAGDDSFTVDATGAAFTLNGGAGADSFVVGRILAKPGESAPAGVEGVWSTRGFLSQGNFSVMTIHGDSGDDYFEVNHNTAELYLYGDDGDDLFLVKTYLQEGSALSNVNGGTGTNSIQYVANGPLHIDGGAGFDRLVIEGTDADDVFVITDTAVYGGGRSIDYTNIEGIVILGGAGNDTFYVLGNNIPLTIEGGSGSDTVNIGGNAPNYVYDAPPYTYDPPPYQVLEPVFSQPYSYNITVPAHWALTYKYLSLGIFGRFALPYFEYVPETTTTIDVPAMFLGMQLKTIDPPPVTIDPNPQTFVFSQVHDFNGVPGGVKRYDWTSATDEPDLTGTPSATFDIGGILVPVKVIDSDIGTDHNVLNVWKDGANPPSNTAGTPNQFRDRGEAFHFALP